MTINHLDRRTVLRGAAIVAAGAGLAACGDDAASPAATSSAAPTTTATAIGSFSEAPAAPVESSDATDAGSAENALGQAADVPVGSGVIFEDAKVVVTQPTAGSFKAFSAVCTHQGCLVSKVETDKILCNCHGSSFSITDGSVLGGPAPTPLPAQDISVDAGNIRLGSS
jgi:Rieske Fe-S protein